MAGDEGTASETDEETDNGQTSGGVDEAGQGSWDGSPAKDHGKWDSWSVLVAHRTEKETHEDGSSDTNNGGGPDLLLGEPKGILDLTKKGGDSEPDEEGNEKSPPRVVKCSHVRAGKVAKLDLRGSVILVGVDGKDVRLVRLIFFGLHLKI